MNKSDSSVLGPAIVTSLLSGRLLLRNTIWNILGMSVPLVIALFTIPQLIRSLGTDRFGLLTILWAAIGYFSLFDLGLGRALTKLVAERLGTERRGELARFVGTALGLMTTVGVGAALLFVLLSPWLIADVFNVALELRSEARLSMQILAMSLPIVILSAAFVGVLEATQQFFSINVVRIPLGAFTYLGPLLAIRFWPNLVAATLSLAVARLIACAVYFSQCVRAMPALRSHMTWDRSLVRPLLSFGGWLTVSNVVGPFMVYFDRFFIGALLTMSAVAYYATPYEMVSRLLVIPTALAAVLYPALATASAVDESRLVRLYGRSTFMLLLTMFLPIAAVVLFAPDGLRLWLGADFASKSTVVLRWLALGIFLNSVARNPYAVVQAVGRPDLTAKLHVLELPIYAALLWWLTFTLGIVGAAIAWTVRAALDAILLFWISTRLVPSLRRQTLRIVLFSFASAIVMWLLTLIQQPIAKGATLVVMTILITYIFSLEVRSIPRSAILLSSEKDA